MPRYDIGNYLLIRGGQILHLRFACGDVVAHMQLKYYTFIFSKINKHP
jgi:hypothetical protein